MQSKNETNEIERNSVVPSSEIITTKNGDQYIKLTSVTLVPLKIFASTFKTLSQGFPAASPVQEIDRELSPKEAAHIKGVSKETIYRRVKSGELKSFQFGKGSPIIIKKSDLDALVLPRQIRGIKF